MKLKKVSSMILAVTLACTMTVTPVLADEVSDLKQKKQETQNQVSNLQTQLNSLMTKISDLENDLIETDGGRSEDSAGGTGTAVCSYEASY